METINTKSKFFASVIFIMLSIFLISCKQKHPVIGKPIKIGNLEIAQNDFPVQMNWDDAMQACDSLGDGWHLPSISELNSIYLQKDLIGGFKKGFYWSSTGYRDAIPRELFATAQEFDFGRISGGEKKYLLNVRAVRLISE